MAELGPVQRAPDARRPEHLAEAVRVLSLPVEVTGLRWHPFGVYTLPLAKRTRPDGTWSRRLHVWHPSGEPVGEASPYGVHTHSGPARSHVLLGRLCHHLYAFEEADGPWRRTLDGQTSPAALTGHVSAFTATGMTHDLPKDRPHGVTRPGGLAISLFEQRDGPVDQPFTTWQRTDLAPQGLVRRPPTPVDQVRCEALAALDAVSVPPPQAD